MFSEHQPGWSGSVRQILTDESNPHLRGIFHSGANPTLPSSNQTATGTGSLQPDSPRSPTKRTVRVCILMSFDTPLTLWGHLISFIRVIFFLKKRNLSLNLAIKKSCVHGTQSSMTILIYVLSIWILE